MKSYPNREAQTQLVRECNVICADVNRCVDEVRILWPGEFAEHTWSWCAIDEAEGLRGGDLSSCALTLMLLWQVTLTKSNSRKKLCIPMHSFRIRHSRPKHPELKVAGHITCVVRKQQGVNRSCGSFSFLYLSSRSPDRGMVQHHPQWVGLVTSTNIIKIIPQYAQADVHFLGDSRSFQVDDTNHHTTWIRLTMLKKKKNQHV